MEPKWKVAANSLGLLLLRLGMGGYMATHGWGKLQMVLAGNFQFADPIGLGPTASLILVMLAEFVCALLVMIGLATRLAALPIVFAMGVAAFVAHAKDPWTMAKAFELFRAGETQFPASKEPALLFLVAFLALVLTGAGKYSVDAWIAGARRSRSAQ